MERSVSGQTEPCVDASLRCVVDSAPIPGDCALRTPTFMRSSCDLLQEAFAIP